MTTTEPVLAPGHAEQIQRRAEALPLETLLREAEAKQHAAERALPDWLAASSA